MHSPFVFDFILRVLNNGNHYELPAVIEEQRQALLKDERVLKIEDMGAGSRLVSSPERRVKDLAKSALKPPKYAQLLYRLVRHYTPQNIIELGTSLGITTNYLSFANPDAYITTIEGSKEVLAIAREQFDRTGVKNINPVCGNFDDVLPGILSSLKKADLVYIDGNHRKEPTVRYFHQLLPYCHENSILVFDDIHWSPEMEGAWRIIREHPSVRTSIDIFFLGFIFFRKGFREKQDFSIRF